MRKRDAMRQVLAAAGQGATERWANNGCRPVSPYAKEALGKFVEAMNDRTPVAWPTKEGGIILSWRVDTGVTETVEIRLEADWDGKLSGQIVVKD